MRSSNLSHDPSYIPSVRGFPFAEVVQRVEQQKAEGRLSRSSRSARATVLLEVRFVRQHLLGDFDKPDIELVLFDISQPLLNTAYQYALDTFGEQSLPVHTLMMQGNFHDLAQYPKVSYAPARGRRRRIYAMLGNTLANLDNELRFLQHCMSHCRPGDLLFVDIRRRQALTGASVEAIRQADPIYKVRFPKPMPTSPAHDSDALPRSRQLRLRVCDRAAVYNPGGCALDVVATIRTKHQPERRFSMFRVKSYEASKLAGVLARFGWEGLLSLPIGPQDRAPLALSPSSEAGKASDQ